MEKSGGPGTQRSYRDSLGPIREHFLELHNDPKLDQIHAKHIRPYLTWRRVNRRDGNEPLSGRTLAKDRAVLHRLFNLDERLEYRDGNPVSRVQPPKYDGRDPVLLNEDQYEALLRECEASRNPMLTLWTLLRRNRHPLPQRGTLAPVERCRPARRIRLDCERAKSPPHQERERPVDSDDATAIRCNARALRGDPFCGLWRWPSSVDVPQHP